jgi:competence protein ComEC
MPPNSLQELREQHQRAVTYQPTVLVVIPLVIGIVISHSEWVNFFGWQWFAVAAIASFIGWATCCWLPKFSSKRMVDKRMLNMVACFCLYAAILFSGAIWHHANWTWFHQHDIGRYASEVSKPCAVEAIAVSEPRSMAAAPFDPELDTMKKNPRMRIEIEIVKIRDGQHWKTASGKIDLTVLCDSNPFMETAQVRAGDKIRVIGSLSKIRGPTNPGQYDFGNFYRSQRKLANLFCFDSAAIEVLESNPSARHWRSQLRQQLDKVIWTSLSEDQASFASAILLGNREQMDRGSRDRFLTTGTVHLLAISGLHVGILAGSFFFLFRLGIADRVTCLWLTVAFVIFYAWLVEFRPTVLRAAILIIVFCLARIWGKPSLSFGSLSVAAILVLLVNPSDLFAVGPQLSFLAIASITLGKDWIYPQPIRDPLDRLIVKTRPEWMQRCFWLGRQARSMVMVSSLIWLLALPLVAYRFHLCAPVALLINPLLLVPITLALYCGLATLILGYLLPQAAPLTGWMAERNLSFIESMIDWADGIPGSHFWTAGPTLTSIVIFYVGLFFVAVFPKTRLPGRWVAVLVAFWFVFGWMIPDRMEQRQRMAADEGVVCTLIDVGHGSAILLEFPNGKTILYDSGSLAGSSFATRTVSDVLWHKRIDHLDAIVVSHADVDHFNAIPGLIERFSIGIVYLTPMMDESESPAVARLKRDLAIANVPIRLLTGGFASTDPSLIDVKLLGPLESPNSTQPNTSDNANSAVVLIEHAGRKILLPGDIEGFGLISLFNQKDIDVDFLMAAHHGSIHSSPTSFARWCKPEHIGISCGDKKVGPNREAIFQAGYNARIARTDRDGAIQFTIQRDGSTQFETWTEFGWTEAR